MPKPESILTTKIITALRKRGGWWFKVHGGPQQKKGVPDILGCYKGYFFAFEVKVPDGSYGATELQKENIRLINKSEGTACVITSVEEALKILQETIDHRGKG